MKKAKRYSKRDVACCYCLYYERKNKKSICKLPYCCCEAERREAGYKEEEIYPYANTDQ